MSRQQIATLLAPIVLIAVMYPIFQLLARRFGNTAAWFTGLATYWLLWGLTYPLLVLGKDAALELIQPGKFDLNAMLLALIPVIFSVIGRYQFGVQYEKASTLAGLALLATAVGNGLFEEVFWRGTFLRLFPSSALLAMLWPSVWFALWHYVPGSVSSSGGVLRLMVGAAFFGLFLSYLARRTDTIFWGILSHTLAGIIMVV